jgi:protein involved in polysaccharide export with SLBB domain
VKKPYRKGFIFLCNFSLWLLPAGGCDAPVSSERQLEEFEHAGIPVWGTNEEPEKGRINTGVYRVAAGDMLEFQMPAILQVSSPNLSDLFEKPEPYLCRVSDAGTITLPIIGEMNVVGKTFTEIEALVVDAYYPKYVVNRPAVVCKVKDHRNQRVFAVMGLVKNPNTFPYPPDVQYNLMNALAFAGGLDVVADPHYVSVYRQDAGGTVVSAVFKINGESAVKAYSVGIKPGDVVYVGQTGQTRLNTFLSNVLNIGVGADVRYGR